MKSQYSRTYPYLIRSSLNVFSSLCFDNLQLELVLRISAHESIEDRMQIFCKREGLGIVRPIEGNLKPLRGHTENVR